MKKRMTLLVCSLLCTSTQAGIIADTIYKEAAGEPLLGKVAIATVIYNRSKERKLSLEQVCLQRKQFSCWNNGYKTVVLKNPAERAAHVGCLEIEKQLLGNTFLPTGKWNHYHTLSVKPVWTAQMKDVAVLGNHKFGRIGK